MQARGGRRAAAPRQSPAPRQPARARRGAEHRGVPAAAQAPAVERRGSGGEASTTAAAGTGVLLPLRPRRCWAPRTAPSFRDACAVVDIPLSAFEQAPPPGCVTIAVGVAGVNGGCETFRARGEHWFAGNADAAAGFALGAEGVGVVVDKGIGCVEDPDDPGFLPLGARVAFVGGAFSEAVILPETSCFRVQSCGAAAAALMISGSFASCGVFASAGAVREGDTVLVMAAAGGGGHFFVQMAKRAGARHVVAVCGGEEKAAAVRSLCCADRIIDHRAEDVGAVLAEEYPDGIDVAYEGVGGLMFEAALANMARGGRLMVAGYISSYPHTYAAAPPRPSRYISKHTGMIENIFWRGHELELDGVRITSKLWAPSTDERRACRRRAFELAATGAITPLIDRSRFVGVESVADAVDYMLSGQSIGKVVVDINPEVLDVRSHHRGETDGRAPSALDPEYFI